MQMVVLKAATLSYPHTHTHTHPAWEAGAQQRSGCERGLMSGCHGEVGGRSSRQAVLSAAGGERPVLGWTQKAAEVVLELGKGSGTSGHRELPLTGGATSPSFFPFQSPRCHLFLTSAWCDGQVQSLFSSLSPRLLRCKTQ